MLGDDVVIADEAVAACYYQLMVEYLGVDINLSKSLVSDNGVMEFAKRLVSPTKEYSPLGAKNVVLALKKASQLPSLFLDGIGKGISITQKHAKARMFSITPDIIRLTFKERYSIFWSMLAPFGPIPNYSAIAPPKVERYTRIYENKVLTRAIADKLYSD